MFAYLYSIWKKALIILTLHYGKYFSTLLVHCMYKYRI